MRRVEKIEVNIDSLRENYKEFIKNNILILKFQQIFRSKKHNVCTEEVNKIALSANNDKRIQEINLVETFEYETRKDLVFKKKEIKCNDIIKKYKNLLTDVTEGNINEHNPNWPRFLIIHVDN